MVLIITVFLAGCNNESQGTDAYTPQHEIILHDIDTVIDSDLITKDIYQDDNTVVLYGHNIDLHEIMSTLLNDPRVLTNNPPGPSSDETICYACITTCINQTVYVGFYRISWDSNEATISDMQPVIDEYLNKENLLSLAHEFRAKKDEYYAFETCGIMDILQ